MSGESSAGEAGAPARLQLFMAFFKIGLVGFGGVAAWVRRVLVEERGWLSDRDFAELQGVASVLPGANTVNLAVMLGDRYRGPSGALAAACGLLAAPLACLALVLLAYQGVAQQPAVRGALAGAAAATAGLVIGTGWKLLRALAGERLALGVAAATFAAVGLAHWPLSVALSVVAPLSVGLFAVTRRRK
ncbi:chromate transporter [Methylocella sp.]|uniref:chromate transporter n=1 Tax=Methylocella sp. TaxID=1978226 RepID=UPI0037839DD8